MVAFLMCLPFVSCVEDDPDNYRCPMVNKGEFRFSQEGGIDTLYVTNNKKYEVWNVELSEMGTHNPILEAYMCNKDTVFLNNEKEPVGHITYKEGKLYSLDTEWYSVYRDEKAKDLRYIIQAHPSQDTHEMYLLLTIKHGSLAVKLTRE